MTFPELHQLLLRLKYKPEARFKAKEDPTTEPPSILIEIIQQLSNAKASAPNQKIPIIMIKRFSFREIRHMDQVTMVDKIYRMVQDMELHEVAEWFKLDGLHFVEPHPDTTSTALTNFKAKMWNALSRSRSG